MKILATVGLALMLLTPLACSSQQVPKVEEKPVGYDIASCSEDNFYVVHFKTVGDDISLVTYTESPGQVDTLPGPVLYKFVKEDAAGKHYTATVGKDLVELTFKFEKHTAMGTQQHDGIPVSVIFGMQADGSKLSENAVQFAMICAGIRAAAPSAAAPTTPVTPAPAAPAAPQKQSGGDDYNMPDYFGRKGDLVKI